MNIIAAVACLAMPASAHWTDHWNGFDKLASQWLQDLDHQVCDRMGQILGVMPGVSSRCQQKLSHPIELSTTELVTISKPHMRRCQNLAFTLKKERAANKRIESRLSASRRQAMQAKWELEQLKQFKAEAGFNETCPLSKEGLASECVVPTSVVLILVSALVAWFVVKGMAQKRGDLQKQLHDKTSELIERVRQASIVNQEISSDTVRISDTDTFDSTDADFSFHIFDDQKGEEMMRYIKIKCPGVQHNDVIVDVMGNGCIVTIDRKPSQGVDAAEWVRMFTFQVSDGRFDLRDDQVKLDGGFLTLAFRAIRSRVFRFPKHFDMSAADDDEGDAWLHEDSPAAHCADSTIFRASQALRMAAATNATVRVSVVSPTLSCDGDPELQNGGALSSPPSSSCDTSEDFEKLSDAATYRGGFCAAQ